MIGTFFKYLSATVAISTTGFAQPVLAALPATTVTPKVLIVTMFGSEAKPWEQHAKFTHTYPLPGLSADYPDLKCNDQAVCMLTTAMGYANAATTLTSVAFSSQLDLRQTYIIIAGIGGVDPRKGTLGSAHWAQYVIDGGLVHRIDARQMPKEWTTGMFALGTIHPGEKPKWHAGSEVFELNGALVNKAYMLSKNVELLDTPEAQADRKMFPVGSVATKAPFVSVCDTVSTDTFWVGSAIANAMDQYAKLLTDGAADVCTSQMEDNASLTALKRGADAGKLDFNRVLVLRTASDYDQEAPGQTPVQALAANGSGYKPAVVNAYRVADAVTQDIIAHWAQWQDGI
ncbi:purine nucleoside permease [Shewanella yunxiaonensis]|uniref:Purine nucleoside permease n=1 Tax=Shewanella yunxiaonensis TaxID=2829809 RepID=A0ABX7YPJ9_9GAMM|nr:purine nucleoside permease [Shewanella yunxiaonensis]QUN04653.1 purine nucleoside permease [Shewanella yunxiaonensis]